MFLPPTFPSDHHADYFRFNTEWDWQSQRIDIRVIHYGGMGGRIVTHGEPIVMTPVEGGAYIHPTLSLDKKQAQELMDQLWRCGCRPTEGSGSAGSLAATQNHLEDMRKLVFRAHGIHPDERK